MLYHLMGEPVPSHLEGDARPSLERRPRPVGRVEASEDPGMRATGGDFGTPTEAGEEEVTSRIQTIGYGG